MRRGCKEPELTEAFHKNTMSPGWLGQNPGKNERQRSSKSEANQRGGRTDQRADSSLVRPGQSSMWTIERAPALTVCFPDNANVGVRFDSISLGIVNDATP